MQIIDKLAWIYLKNKKILFTRSKGKDVWYLPGGKRIPGESDQEALQREITEELSVELAPDSIQYLATFKAQADGKPEGVIVQITCYTAEYNGELQAASEIEEFAWLDSTVDQRILTPTTRILFEYLKEKNLLQ